MNDDRDLRDRIAKAMTSIHCNQCRQRASYTPSDCDLFCRATNEDKRRADAVMKVLPQPHGLSIKEQAALLRAVCIHPSATLCPVNFMSGFEKCPFDGGDGCRGVNPWAWLPILEKRVIPDTNK